MGSAEVNAAFLTAAKGRASQLLALLNDDVKPGSDLDYQTAKIIYTSHVLGRKMAESPITMAQSQEREIAVQDAPDEVAEEFKRTWSAMQCTPFIHDVCRIARIYGIGAIVIGSEKVPANQEFDMAKFAELSVYFNVLDPLNTAGSLVLNQTPTAPDFNKPVRVATQGMEFHPSRFQVVMNERPIYLAWTDSAYGFSGRSVYQRALYPLKSYLQSMISDDMVQTKLGVFVAKVEQPGSIIDNIMASISAIKRAFVKEAKTGNVLQIGPNDAIETLDMQNVDGAGTYSRTNILKNIATAADMPAKLLENETLVGGFGEGTEDAKNIAAYIESIRQWMHPVYAWFDNFVQYRAWTPDFFKRMQRDHQDIYGGMSYEEAFSFWRSKFSAIWPSLLREPASETIKVSQTKFEAIISLLQTLLGKCGPENDAILIESALENLSEHKDLFPQAFSLDPDELRSWLRKQADKQDAQDEEEAEQVGPEARKFGRFG